MPVEKSGKKTRKLICDFCDVESKSYTPNSPAAPDLDVCEQAEKAEGWAFDIGFWAMLKGHTCACPKCKK